MKDHPKEAKSGLGLKLSVSRFKGVVLSFSSYMWIFMWLVIQLYTFIYLNFCYLFMFVWIHINIYTLVFRQTSSVFERVEMPSLQKPLRSQVWGAEGEPV